MTRLDWENFAYLVVIVVIGNATWAMLERAIRSIAEWVQSRRWRG